MLFNIKNIREEKKITQEQLAELSNVSRTIISGLENGNISTTTTKTLIKLAEALEVKVSDIFLNI